MTANINVQIANHCSSYDFNNGIITLNSSHLVHGSFKAGPVSNIDPMGDGEPVLAFTGYDSHNESMGWVSYNLPNSNGLTMTIHYKSVYTQSSYNTGVYVIVVESGKVGYNANDAGYFVAMENASKWDLGDSPLTATVHVFPSTDSYTITQQYPNKVDSTMISLANKTEGWIQLTAFDNAQVTDPPEMLNGTTSVGPGQQVDILNYSTYTGEDGKDGGPALHYGIDEKTVLMVKQTGGNKVPQISWPNGSGSYTAVVNPDDDGHSAYTITLTG